MTSGSLSTGSKKRRDFDYPFPKTWVYASAVFTVLGVMSAVIFLKEEEDVCILSFRLHPLFVYFVSTFLLTIAIFMLKLRLYSMKGSSEDQVFKGEEKRKRVPGGLIIVYLLAIVALIFPLILWAVLEPLWSFISISSFVPAVSIPEVILYIYSRRSRDEK